MASSKKKQASRVTPATAPARSTPTRQPAIAGASLPAKKAPPKIPQPKGPAPTVEVRAVRQGGGVAGYISSTMRRYRDGEKFTYTKVWDGDKGDWQALPSWVVPVKAKKVEARDEAEDDGEEGRGDDGEGEEL